MSESHLLNAVMREVGKHAAVYRTNSGQFYSRSGQRVSGLPRGFADIMAVLPGGKVAFIECKTEKGKPSPEQLQFISKMQELGAMAGIARSVPDAMQICGLLEHREGVC